MTDLPFSPPDTLRGPHGQLRSSLPVEVRFWSQVQKSETGCWNWIGARYQHSYGSITDQKVRYRAHRFAWIMWFGPIPSGLCVLHRCDNPPCVNPAHLFLGTKADNTQDMLAKGRHGAWVKPDRQARGERNGGAKLTLLQVHAIRSEYDRGGTSWLALARRYGVSKRAIGRILHGETWLEAA